MINPLNGNQVRDESLRSSHKRARFQLG